MTDRSWMYAAPKPPPPMTVPEEMWPFAQRMVARIELRHMRARAKCDNLARAVRDASATSGAKRVEQFVDFCGLICDHHYPAAILLHPDEITPGVREWADFWGVILCATTKGNAVLICREGSP